MFFDRCEIHIQALVVCSNGKCSIFNPHLRKVISKDVLKKPQEIRTKNIENTSTSRKHNKTNWYLGQTFSETNRNFVRYIQTKIIFFQDDPIFLLEFFGAFW